MTINFRLCSDKQLAALHRDLDAVEAFLFGADDEPTIAHNPAHDLHLGDEWASMKDLTVLKPLKEGGMPLGNVGRSFTAADVAQLALSLGPVKQPGEDLQQLKTFLGVAAAKKLGLIVYLS